MTVGIGFQCLDGVVLCSDRQITKSGGLKYEEQKIFEGYYENLQCACAYAHNPDIARNVFDEIFRSLVNVFQRCHRQQIALSDALQETVEDVMRRRKDKNTELLIAFRSEKMGMPPLFFCVRGLVVVKGEREYIGVGDSSALRYVAELLGSFQLTLEQAKLAGLYMVGLASRFIDGCGGTDLLMMPRTERIKMLSPDEIEGYRSKLRDIDRDLSMRLIGLFN
jgi:hypothetical protein